MISELKPSYPVPSLSRLSTFSCSFLGTDVDSYAKPAGRPEGTGGASSPQKGRSPLETLLTEGRRLEFEVDGRESGSPGAVEDV